MSNYIIYVCMYVPFICRINKGQCFCLLGNPVFGVPLEAAIKQTKFPDGIELPRVFREGILYIEDHGKLAN